MVTNIFVNGEIADADKVNTNFSEVFNNLKKKSYTSAAEDIATGVGGSTFVPLTTGKSFTIDFSDREGSGGIITFVRLKMDLKSSASTTSGGLRIVGSNLGTYYLNSKNWNLHHSYVSPGYGTNNSNILEVDGDDSYYTVEVFVPMALVVEDDDIITFTVGGNNEGLHNFYVKNVEVDVLYKEGYTEV